MGSVSSTNPGLTNLLQTLSNLNSPVLSSPAVTSALKKASPVDIVQLSVAANQLQSVDAMFGLSNGAPGSGSSNYSLTSLLAPLEAGVTGLAAPASTTASPGIASLFDLTG